MTNSRVCMCKSTVYLGCKEREDKAPSNTLLGDAPLYVNRCVKVSLPSLVEQLSDEVTYHRRDSSQPECVTQSNPRSRHAYLNNKRVSVRREAPPRSFRKQTMNATIFRVPNVSANPPLQLLDPGSEAPHNLSYPPDLIELILQLIDLTEDGSEAGDLGVGHLYRIASTVILGLRRYLCGAIKLCPRST